MTPPALSWWVPLTWILGAAIVAVGLAMFGIGRIADRPRSILYDDIEPLFEGVAGQDRLKPRRLSRTHYRFTTLRDEVLRVERVGPWKTERDVDSWHVLELHRDSEGVVVRIDALDASGGALFSESIRRDGSTVHVTSKGAVEERDLDDNGRVKRIRVRGPDGKIRAAASIERDSKGRISRRTQHRADGGVAFDAHFVYEDWRFPHRATTERVRGGSCPVKTTTYGDSGRLLAVQCTDSTGEPVVDLVTGCEEIRYVYTEPERRRDCRVAGRAVPEER